jgi:8-amino-7-oxononanoate synthase
MQAEDALVFTTGYQANVGALSTLLQPGDTVIVDSGDHASIMDGVAMSHARIRPFRHNRLKSSRHPRAGSGDGGGVLVVVDGVYSMEGDVCDLRTVVPLAKRYGARVMVDEAHGVGVLGAHGRGACEVLGVEDEVDLRMGTFSKSLASCGGFLAGSREVIDFLRIQSRAFLFTAAAVPAAIGAALEAVRICNSDEGPPLFAKLLDNASYLRDGLKRLGFRVVESEPVTPVVPVLIGDDWQAVVFWKALYDAGVYTNVALYPAVPRGGALLRTSVMATHEREHLDRALAVFDKVRDAAQAGDAA